MTDEILSVINGTGILDAGLIRNGGGWIYQSKEYR